MSLISYGLTFESLFAGTLLHTISSDGLFWLVVGALLGLVSLVSLVFIRILIKIRGMR